MQEEFLNQLPGNHRPADRRKRVLRPLALWVDDRVGGRQQFLAVFAVRHLVVIGYNDREPLRNGACDFLPRRNAVVAGHDGIHILGCRALHQTQVQPVTVRNAVRNIVVRICAERPHAL